MRTYLSVTNIRLTKFEVSNDEENNYLSIMKKTFENLPNLMDVYRKSIHIIQIGWYLIQLNISLKLNKTR